MTEPCFPEVDDMLSGYVDHAETWKSDHEQAMGCRDLEEIVLLGFSLFLNIDIVDMNWRAAVHSDKVEYDPTEEAAIEGLYRKWLRPADAILTKIAAFEAAGYAVKRADQFRRACREANALLTPDPQFFSGDALVERRDQAIDANREGRTVEFHELGD